MAWGAVSADLLTDFLTQFIVHTILLQFGSQNNKQHNPNIVLPLLTDGETFHHLIELLDLTINLSRAYTHTARI